MSSPSSPGRHCRPRRPEVTPALLSDPTRIVPWNLVKSDTGRKVAGEESSRDGLQLGGDPEGGGRGEKAISVAFGDGSWVIRQKKCAVGGWKVGDIEAQLRNAQGCITGSQ